MLATNVVGPLLKRNPERIPECVEKWRNHNSMWLNRTSILFQLKYKKELDTDLLADIISQFSTSKEFFIQKAIGWILRDYSRVNPVWVQQFVDSHSLKPLSVREATRLMKKKA
jgi:3-methyladenine DNA glycosylase AlkD